MMLPVKKFYESTKARVRGSVFFWLAEQAGDATRCGAQVIDLKRIFLN
jgi:hypothetical protein